MSFSSTTVGATAECVGTVSAFAKGVIASTRAVTASAEAVCSFRWSCLQLPLELFQLLQKLLQFPLESFLVFSTKFSLLENIFDEVLEM